MHLCCPSKGDRMSEGIVDLQELVPSAGEPIAWDDIIHSGLSPYIRAMAETPQNPVWHAEGDVLAHAKMACERLAESESWQGLGRYEQEVVFLAVLLHDVGKAVVTRNENGVHVSPNHSAAGGRMVRSLLWRDFGLAGTSQGQQFREAVCALIENHSSPLTVYDSPEPVRKVVTLGSHGLLVPRYSNQLLCVLAEADWRGRVMSEPGEQLDRLEFFRQIAGEAGCWDRPPALGSAYARYAYLSGRNIMPGQDLFDNTWGTVILMSGLPGAGKDTYIQATYPDLPVISLDELRKQLKVSPDASQGKVVAAAQEQAKGYLRQKQPFIWNATNITRSLREKQVRLFTDYGAMVRIVYLEAPWAETLKRNRGRPDPVPESVIAKLLDKLVPPNMTEAHEIEWITVGERRLERGQRYRRDEAILAELAARGELAYPDLDGMIASRTSFPTVD